MRDTDVTKLSPDSLGAGLRCWASTKRFQEAEEPETSLAQVGRATAPCTKPQPLDRALPAALSVAVLRGPRWAAAGAGPADFSGSPTQETGREGGGRGGEAAPSAPFLLPPEAEDGQAVATLFVLCSTAAFIPARRSLRPV
eukprot:8367380-Lingulodinium_polyedra.AAC.1